MKEQFDLFKKPAVEEGAKESPPSESSYYPTDEEVAFSHGEKPRIPEKRLSAKEFAERRKRDLAKFLENPGTQQDLPQ
ncbi:MAG: hypothetical protein HZA25_00460 [Candidatus Niyogibacteria bacterium]|nr:hypothetical protein [Candidatus Niyogibacteria bacterium]